MTYDRPAELPDYDNPPVIEVEVGLAFQPMELPVTRLRDLLDDFADALPIVSEGHPTQTRIVRLDGGMPELRLELPNGSPLPKVVLSSADGSRLMSLQSDSLTCTWKKISSAPYPRYSELRNDFVDTIRRFEAFIEADVGSKIFLAQSHIAYTNETVVLADSEISALAEVLRPTSNSPEALGGFDPSNVGLRLRKDYRNDVSTYAALIINASSVQSEIDTAGRYSVTTRLLFAGNPFQWLQSDNEVKAEDLFSFLDFGHHEIVNVFTSITRPDRQQEWGRKQ